ncbi:MAG: hypothetical protein R3F55_18840 [Alphaproteobacteria bacterium]
MAPDRSHADPTLLPSRAMRLAALGALALRERDYADLAQEIRDLAIAVVGPTPDAFGSSLELLRYDGLIAGGEEGEGIVSITEAGRVEFLRLLVTRLRKPASEFNKLWLALKLRFLPLLPPAEQAEELNRMCALFEGEIARLSALRRHPLTDDGHVGTWIDLEVAENGARLAWCRSLVMRLADGAEGRTG